jgi:hypothetical protein
MAQLFELHLGLCFARLTLGRIYGTVQWVIGIPIVSRVEHLLDPSGKVSVTMSSGPYPVRWTAIAQAALAGWITKCGVASLNGRFGQRYPLPLTTRISTAQDGRPCAPHR